MPRKTSERQRRANRANAKASTGPKTAPGKIKAARNALQHGLSLPVVADPILAPDVEALAQLISNGSVDPELVALAYQIAEAQIELRRVRTYRIQLIASAFEDPNYQSPTAAARLEQTPRALVRANPNDPMTAMMKNLLMRGSTTGGREKTEGPEKLATILSDSFDRLKGLDRYERRALSRRKFAIRAFDARRVELGRSLQQLPGRS